MKTSQLLLFTSFIFLFFMTNNEALAASASYETIHVKKQKKVKKKFQVRKYFKKITKKVKKKISSFIDDGPSMLLGMVAIILGIYGIYYFFSIGYLWGLLAMFAIAFFLYLFFTFLNY